MATTEVVEGCRGMGCPVKIRDACRVYDKYAACTCGYMDSDHGWTCPDYAPKQKSEPEDDDGIGLF